MKKRVGMCIPGMENYVREDREVESMEDNEKIILTGVKNLCTIRAGDMFGKDYWCSIIVMMPKSHPFEINNLEDFGLGLFRGLYFLFL